MNKIEVCLTPELIHQHELNGKIVVVVDIFRATSCIVTGLSHGVVAIKPIGTVEETLSLGEQGLVMAGERGGEKVEGFDMGNSPFEYMDEDLTGRKVAISTTNGSQAILKSLDADEILIGAFLNLSTTANYLAKSKKDVVIHCAGWKGTVNIEDTLYAGALIGALSTTHGISGDSAFVAAQLYQANKGDLLSIAKESSHAHRLAGFGVIKDIAFCVQLDEYDSLIALQDDFLIRI
jgi:2-phosphosulfolactate phosphatase